jgi:hypothetical protein
MNWPLAISRNRAALLAVVAGIVSLLGGRLLRPFDKAGAPDEGAVTSRRLRNAALALLRPAEAAARRLIVVVARGVAAAPRPAPAFAGSLGARGKRGASAVSRPPAFRLFDPPKRYSFRPVAPPPRGVPRIRSFWGAQPVAAAAPPAAARPDPDAPVDASRLASRLAALARALADLPAQARRLARWRAREKVRREAVFRPERPLRLGRPPSWRAGTERAVDLALIDCHRFALEALAEAAPLPDTS